MKVVFADTFYWIAIVHENDQWHSASIKARKALDEKVILVTTDEVLTELLNIFAERHGPYYRCKAAQWVREIIKNPNVEKVAQSRESFLEGLKLYEQRMDKEYSLVDCISMCTMKARSINEVLTNDIHFEQEGFARLIK